MIYNEWFCQGVFRVRADKVHGGLRVRQVLLKLIPVHHSIRVLFEQVVDGSLDRLRHLDFQGRPVGKVDAKIIDHLRDEVGLDRLHHCVKMVPTLSVGLKANDQRRKIGIKILTRPARVQSLR